MSEIIPVLLGADLNCYSMARAFHEAYKIKSFVFGKCELGAVKRSKIVNFSVIPPLENENAVLKILVDFASSFDEKPYLFGCTDEYALFIIKNKKELSKHFVCKCPNADIFETISEKSAFYKKCDEQDLPYPEYVEMASLEDEDLLSRMPFGYPVIIKPSNSAEYWRHPFDGMKKVYTAEKRAEAEKIIKEVFTSGYSKKLIIQRKIDGDQYVNTCFSENGDVFASCSGRVLLGETTPKGLGNHTAIISERLPEIEETTAKFIKAVSYSGFSNFDIMKETASGKFYLLEVNPRQGRSNYYMSAAGMNLAKPAVEGKSDLPFRQIFWHSVPKGIVCSCVSLEDSEKISELARRGLSFSPLIYPYDMKDPIRAAYILLHNIGFYKKYRND